MKIRKVNMLQLKQRLSEPFVISFKTFYFTESIVVAIETDEGIYGYGEAAPFKPITGDSIEEAKRFLSTAIKAIIGQNPCNIEGLHEILRKIYERSGFDSHCAKAALDFACYDILGKVENKPIYQLLGFREPRIIPTTVTLSIKSPDDMAKDAQRLMSRFKEENLKRVKLKIAGDPNLDKERTLAVAAVFPGELTLDANQGYKDPKTAVKVFNELYDSLKSRVVLIEQPCPKGRLDMLKYVTENCEIPIFADESVASMRDAQKIIETKSAKGINIKLQKVGGIYLASHIAKLAEMEGLYTMVGCMHGDREISIAAAANFSAGTGNILNTDLDMDLLYPLGVTCNESKILFKHGARIPSNKAGLGIELNHWVKHLLDGTIYVRQFGQST